MEGEDYVVECMSKWFCFGSKHISIQSVHLLNQSKVRTKSHIPVLLKADGMLHFSLN